MEAKLVTLAILTYSKAQILKHILENEGIETYIHNVNLIQPVVSSGVRVRIKESDLPQALKIVENSLWLTDNSQGEDEEKKEITKKEDSKLVLVPIDFSNYSLKACEFGFNFAKEYNAEVVLLHVYFSPIYTSSLPYGDVFNYQIAEEESLREIAERVNQEVKVLSEDIKKRIENKELPDIKYSCILREGIPEEEIIRYSKEHKPLIIVMGTRGKSQKEIDLIGSVTAEVLDRSHFSVLAIPENTPFTDFKKVKKLAFITNFEQRDLVTFDGLFKKLSPFHFSVSLIHLAETKDTWDEIKLAGIKEYFQKQYPGLEVYYDIVMEDDILSNFDNYVSENKIDAIALVSYKRNVFARLFNPSIARKMIFHTDTPLLVINDKQQ